MTFGIRKSTFRLESNRKLFRDVDLWKLEDMWDKWRHISVTVYYHDTEGKIDVEIRDLQDSVLCRHEFVNITTWNQSGVYDFVRPKWGLYRKNTGYTEDHSVYFSDFEVRAVT
ncbi:hypothetical protein SARC_14027 [Sphaeroforma arctica JP610]|uniref:Uncharacterized protein n=1 Tax=Sphaeroforma arctica JP610 TaxID=667725 RepID=A0A0L0F9M4_9EUKA|nr:hypothetical protein SARC_14027 [Sphaeroforma arctica JP610]KNC73415.1 hypothetical protein SARC_14027 [Sphaeroforma arctica JP610]|eukprot:XP_014147317.1 hypothetical protein SARC_14027 [Sphaeroforma arctica JP610]